MADSLTFGREVTPETVGMSKEKVRHIGALFDQQFAQGLHSGGQLVLLRHGEVVLDRRNGVARLGTHQSIRPDTPFLTFSCTKPITSICIHQLIENVDLIVASSTKLLRITRNVPFHFSE